MEEACQLKRGRVPQDVSVSFDKDAGQLRDLKALGKQFTFAKQGIENMPPLFRQGFIIALSLCKNDVRLVYHRFGRCREHLIDNAGYRRPGRNDLREGIHADIDGVFGRRVIQHLGAAKHNRALQLGEGQA